MIVHLNELKLIQREGTRNKENKDILTHAYDLKGEIKLIKELNTKESKLATYIRFKPNGEKKHLNTIQISRNDDNELEKTISHRGLFKTEDGLITHSDVNGSYNMGRVDESNVNAGKDEIKEKKEKFKQIKNVFDDKLGNLPFDERKKIMQRPPLKINKINEHAKVTKERVM